MQDFTRIIICAYIVVVSLLAVGLTVCDKRSARKGSWRVKESTLLLISCLGGSIAMLVTMYGIRHKTKHARFMVGIPIIIGLQIAGALAFWWVRGGALWF